MNILKKKYLENLSKNIRLEIIKMLAEAKSGHPGGSLSSADIFVSLYFSGLVNINKKNFKLRTRDYIILSAGHYCPALYAVLAYKNFFNKKKIKNIKKVWFKSIGTS